MWFDTYSWNSLLIFICTLHHLIIIIMQTYFKTLNLSNACQIHFVECVSKIKHILSVIHYTICGAVCFQFTHFPCDDWENIYTLSYYHHQIGSMNHFPLFSIRSWINGKRCMSFCILIYISFIQHKHWDQICFIKWLYSKCRFWRVGALCGTHYR